MRYFFIVLALVLAFVNVNAQFSHPPYGTTYNPNIVGRIDIAIPADSLAFILNPINANSDHEFMANMQITLNNQTDTVNQVGFRLRGNTSRQAQKKSFKIVFNAFTSGRRYQGVKSFNLNGEHNDPSLSRARLCWELGAAFGLPVSRSAHYQLYINGAYYGLYINIEHINDDWLTLRFGSAAGNLYKCNWSANLNFISNNPNDYKFVGNNGTRIYEIKTNEQIDDYTKLAHFINVLNNTPAHLLACALDTVFDTESYLKTLAFEVATGHWDNYSFNKNNYYLYENPENGKIVYIPYDMDNTFGVDWFNIDWATRNVNNWGNTNENLPLSQKILAIPQLNEIYKYYLKSFNNLINSSAFALKVDSMQQQLRPYVLLDTFRTLDYGFTIADFDQSFNRNTSLLHVKKGIKPYATQRAQSIQQQLGVFNIAPIVRDLRFTLTTSPNQAAVTVFVEDETAVNVVCQYSFNGGSNQTIVLYDDGNHGDGAAGDGTFGNWLNGLPNSGYLQYQITATDATNRTRIKPCFPKNFTIPIGRALVINEFMAENTSTIADNNGSFSDWIELYNNSNDSVFLGDYYLTDKTNNPFLWQLPSETIAPYGFKLIWASNNIAAGTNHANFALSRGGERIGLFKNNAGIADTIDFINFGAQSANISFGRAFDASPVWVFFTTPTPNASNGVSVNLHNTSILNETSVYPNPYQGQVFIKNPSPKAISYRMLNALGQQIQNGKIESGESHVIQDGFASGLRFLYLISNGEVKIFKLMSQ